LICIFIFLLCILHVTTNFTLFDFIAIIQFGDEYRSLSPLYNFLQPPDPAFHSEYILQLPVSFTSIQNIFTSVLRPPL
jgi:hypothetical protein